MAVIKLINLTKKYGNNFAVNNLNIEIKDESFTTLLGPSGCGKTTTLRMIAGLETPTSGEIYIDDKCVFSSEKKILVLPKDRNLGLVFQSYALWPHLTVFDNIAFGLQVKKINKEEIKLRVDEIAKSIKIDELLHRYPSELSGGQQQRVAIARVLIMKPDVLLLDEPLSNLDAKLRMDMRSELKRLHKETKGTIIYVTHDQLEALTMSTDVVLLEKGLLQDWAAPMELYHRPSNLFTCNFMGSPKVNLFKGKIENNQFVSKNFTSKLPIELNNKDDVTLALRCEDVKIYKDENPYCIKAKVYSVLPAGSIWYINLKIKDEDISTFTVYEDLDLDIDDDIYVQIIIDRMKLFSKDGFLIE